MPGLGWIVFQDGNRLEEKYGLCTGKWAAQEIVIKNPLCCQYQSDKMFEIAYLSSDCIEYCPTKQ